MLWFAFNKGRVTIWRDHYPSDIACAQAIRTLRRHFAGSEVDVRESTIPVVEIEPLEGDDKPEFEPPPLADLDPVPMKGEPEESAPGILTVTTEMEGKALVKATTVTEALPDFEAVSPIAEHRCLVERVWQSRRLWREPARPCRIRLRWLILPPALIVSMIFFGELGEHGNRLCYDIGELLTFCFVVLLLIGFFGVPYWIITAIECLCEPEDYQPLKPKRKFDFRGKLKSIGDVIA